MEFDSIWRLHRNIRGYLHHVCEGQYYAIAFCTYFRDYIEQQVPDVEFNTYHSDVNTITIATDNSQDLYDILVYALPDVETISDGVADDGYWYADIEVVDLIEFFGNQLTEYGDDS